MKEKIRQVPLLECRNLSKQYGKKVILKSINLEIGRGKIVGLLGPNGVGKTTLIKLATGLLTPSTGTITINGLPIGVETKAQVSYLPEQPALNKTMTTQQLVRFYADFYDDFDCAKALRLLGDLKLDPTERLQTMSKGTQEKVALVLTMSRQANLYILDEPLGGVDPATRDYILSTILSNFGIGEASLIISTHLISDIERILDEVIFINDGEVFLTGNADQLRDKYHQSIDEIFRKEFKNVQTR